MLACTAQQNESATHTHISPPFWTSFPFRAPQSTEWGSCAVQSVAISYLFYTHQWCPCVNPSLPVPSTLPSHLAIYVFTLNWLVIILSNVLIIQFVLRKDIRMYVCMCVCERERLLIHQIDQSFNTG